MGKLYNINSKEYDDGQILDREGYLHLEKDRLTGIYNNYFIFGMLIDNELGCHIFNSTDGDGCDITAVYDAESNSYNGFYNFFDFTYENMYCLNARGYISLELQEIPAKDKGEKLKELQDKLQSLSEENREKVSEMEKYNAATMIDLRKYKDAQRAKTLLRKK